MSDGEHTIDGYQLTNNCIAGGNSSEIWEIVDSSGGSLPLCMKLLTPNALEDPAAKATLKHEAKVGKALEHPSIIKIHRVAVTRDHGYILMDYFRAPNIKQQTSGDMVGLHSRFRKVFEGICLSLGYMHEKGWVHKDIKPENILSNKVGEMRLIDFSLSVRAAGGLGKLLGSRSKTVQGTRTYIAPETLLKKSPTFQTDMYSLGITIFEMLTGNPPFRGMSPNELLRMHVQEKAPPVSAVNQNVTPEMDRLVARLLEKKPANRHKSMEEVYSEFRALKVFKEDPRELEARRMAKAKEDELSALGASERINSRRDHQRSEAGLTPDIQQSKSKPTPKPQPTPARQPQPQQPQPQQPQPQQPVMGQGYGFPPGMQPPQGYPMPQQPPGGFPPGMQPPPGYPMPQQPPGGFPPGYAPGPGQPPQQQPPPQQPQQPLPQAGSPQPPAQQPQPRPQQQPPAQQPAASQPSSPQPGNQPEPQQPPAQQPPAQPKKREHPPTQTRKEDENLPVMDIDDLDVL